MGVAVTPGPSVYVSGGALRRLHTTRVATAPPAMATPAIAATGHGDGSGFLRGVVTAEAVITRFFEAVRLAASVTVSVTV